MTYYAMARKWRPQSFSEVIGQSHITDTLAKAVESGRVAAAFLFAGPRGSGKTTVARILSKAVNCERRKGGEPCNKCDSCLAIAEGRSLDVLEIDGASNNSVDDVRELRENVRYAPSAPGKRKVYIVDEVHMLSTGAFNALLKTLEEPPPHVLFIFATTEARKVPGTVLSRCQRFDFRRLLTEEILERLQVICKKEKIDIENEALYVLAKRADGSLRDALSLLDQVLSSATGRISEGQIAEILGVIPVEIYLDLTEAFLEHDSVRALEILHGTTRHGGDPASFALGLVEHLRNLLLLSIDPKLRGSVQLGDVHMKRGEAQAARFKTEDLLYLLNRAAGNYEEVRRASQPGVLLEAAMVELARFESRVVLRELLERLQGTSDPSPEDAPRGGRAPARGSGTERATPPRAGTKRPPSGEARGSADADPDEAQIVPMDFGRSAAMGAEAASATGAAGAAESVQAAGASAGRAAFVDLHPGAVEPAATPTPAQGAASLTGQGGLSLESVEARWNDFTQAVRESKAMMAHCLSEGRPTALQGSVLEISFPAEHTFHLHYLQEGAMQREVEHYLAAFFGQRLRASLRSADQPRPAPAAERAPEADVAAPATATNAAPEPGARRITPEDVARSRRGAIEDVVQGTPGLEDIINAFDGEVLDDQGA